MSIPDLVLIVPVSDDLGAGIHAWILWPKNLGKQSSFIFLHQPARSKGSKNGKRTSSPNCFQSISHKNAFKLIICIQTLQYQYLFIIYIPSNTQQLWVNYRLFKKFKREQHKTKTTLVEIIKPRWDQRGKKAVGPQSCLSRQRT